MSAYETLAGFPPPHGAMFHHFHGGMHPVGQGSISADDLREMIEFIGRDRILPPQEWIRGVTGKTLETGATCLTFDDGLKCQYDIALPVLEEYGLTAFFFIPSLPLEGGILPLELYRHIRHACFASMEDFYAAFNRQIAASPYADECAAALQSFDPSAYLAEFRFYTDGDRTFRFIRDKVLGPNRYAELMDALAGACMKERSIDPSTLHDRLWMSPDDVRDLAGKGHMIGLHSHTHPTALGALPADEQHTEYRRNKDCLAPLAGMDITAMSHPCNSYNDDTLGILRDAGITIGFRSMMSGGSGTDLELPRQDHSHIFAMMQAA